ncbi:hypothetical protein [Streptomyces sp. NPDC004546]|uniref:hypothetical protein n=1 Tax=Streptomyces sp. NPDC004546 TaxID=3154282 RepID=UPI0033B2767C
MAADRFTQVANGLFRDSRISYRAKGLFGCISTHRNGWLVTIAALVALGRDGRDAVRAGLRELEMFGYLVRDRVRRPNGTLGEIVYSITDCPAVPDVPPVDPATPPAFPGAAGGPGYGAGIRRGVMGADQFTQIANGLFRNSRLSFKAKGPFGLISTHRDGWRMTVTDLARRGRDGEAAVKSGLKELRKPGFLLRERERNPDGTLGQAAYVITDLPSLRSSRSQPMSGFPPVDNPTSVHRPPKNTIVKKTNKQKTSPLRPCEHGDTARTNAGTVPSHATTPATPPPRTDEMHAGIRLLLELGASRPELLLTVQALTDQGRVATVMLDSGWSAEQLRRVITRRPLPSPVRTSVGGIIAARLRAAQAYLPPPARHRHPARRGRRTVRGADQGAVIDSGRHPLRDPGRHLPGPCGVRWLRRSRHRPRRGPVPGLPRLAAVPRLPGLTPRRAHSGDGRCTTCTTASTRSAEGSSA